MADLFSLWRVQAASPVSSNKLVGASVPFTIRALVPCEHDGVKLELYPVCQSNWSQAEKAYAFNINRSLLSNSKLSSKQKCDLLALRCGQTAAVDITIQALKAEAIRQLRESAVSVVGYYDCHGDELPPAFRTETLADGSTQRSLKEMPGTSASGEQSTCRPVNVHFAKVQVNVDLSSAVPGVSIPTPIPFQFFHQLPITYGSFPAGRSDQIAYHGFTGSSDWWRLNRSTGPAWVHGDAIPPFLLRKSPQSTEVTADSAMAFTALEEALYRAAKENIESLILQGVSPTFRFRPLDLFNNFLQVIPSVEVGKSTILSVTEYCDMFTQAILMFERTGDFPVDVVEVMFRNASSLLQTQLRAQGYNDGPCSRSALAQLRGIQEFRTAALKAEEAMATLRNIATETFGRPATNFSTEVHMSTAERTLAFYKDGGTSKQLTCWGCGGNHNFSNCPRKEDPVCQKRAQEMRAQWQVTGRANSRSRKRNPNGNGNNNSNDMRDKDVLHYGPGTPDSKRQRKEMPNWAKEMQANQTQILSTLNTLMHPSNQLVPAPRNNPVSVSRTEPVSETFDHRAQSQGGSRQDQRSPQTSWRRDPNASPGSNQDSHGQSQGGQRGRVQWDDQRPIRDAYCIRLLTSGDLQALGIRHVYDSHQHILPPLPCEHHLLPHFRLPLGVTESCDRKRVGDASFVLQPQHYLGLMCMFDTGASLNVGYLPHHLAIARAFPDVVRAVYVADNTTYGEILLGGIVANESQVTTLTCSLPAVIEYQLPFVNDKHQPMMVRVALGMNVGVNTVIGMHTIRNFRMVLDPGDNVIEARNFLHCKPFPATYESGKITIPNVGRSGDKQHLRIMTRLDDLEKSVLGRIENPPQPLMINTSSVPKERGLVAALLSERSTDGIPVEPELQNLLIEDDRKPAALPDPRPTSSVSRWNTSWTARSTASDSRGQIWGFPKASLPSHATVDNDAVDLIDPAVADSSELD